jgi:hypothetical protein
MAKQEMMPKGLVSRETITKTADLHKMGLYSFPVISVSACLLECSRPVLERTLLAL